ncbi:MAG TPA: hypothetical protein PLW44_16600 [Chitinophagales bacterium]|nr:hypothetical protein [Chitinophagales bacterium]
MKVTLNIDDSKAAFLLELLDSLDYVTIDSENLEVPEWHKKIVMDRVNDPNAKFTEAEEFFKKLDKKYL